MDNQFYEFEILMIEKEIRRKSYADIAFLLDRPVEEVSAFINDYLIGKDIVTFQQLLDQRLSERPARIKKPKQPREPKPEKKKEKVISSRVIIPDRRPRAESRRRYKTLEVDYSTLRTVRIDSKTFIYIKDGEDPATAKDKYLASLTPRKFLPTNGVSTEVKKIKPIK